MSFLKVQYFNEFVVKLNKPVKEINQKLLEKNIIGGYDLGRDYPELAKSYADCGNRIKNEGRN